jgi:hypothetical protein
MTLCPWFVGLGVIQSDWHIPAIDVDRGGLADFESSFGFLDGFRLFGPQFEEVLNVGKVEEFPEIFRVYFDDRLAETAFFEVYTDRRLILLAGMLSVGYIFILCIEYTLTFAMIISSGLTGGKVLFVKF